MLYILHHIYRIEFKLSYQLESVANEIQQRDDVTSIVGSTLSFIEEIKCKISPTKILGAGSFDIKFHIQSLQVCYI